MEATLEAVNCSYVPDNVRMSSDDKRTTIRFTTSEVDRHGTIVDPRGIDFTHYMRNPVVKWNHGNDPMRGNLPIAKATRIWPDGDSHVAEVEWYDDEFSQNIKRMMKGGFVNMASFSWIPVEMDETTVEGRKVPVFKRAEALEFSIVDIGSNRGSHVIERSFSAMNAEVEALKMEIEQLKQQRSAATGERAEPDAAPLDSDEAGTAETSASGVPESSADKPEAAKQEPEQVAPESHQPIRQAAQSDYEAMVKAMQPVITQSVLRMLGKA